MRRFEIATANEKLKRLEILNKVRDWNRISDNRKLLFESERNYADDKRQVCPVCHESYLITAYIKARWKKRDGKRINKWVRIGKFCPSCNSFFVDLELIEDVPEVQKIKSGNIELYC